MARKWSVEMGTKPKAAVLTYPDTWVSPGLGDLPMLVCLDCDHRGPHEDFPRVKNELVCPQCKKRTALAEGSHTTIWILRENMARRLGVQLPVVEVRERVA